VAADQADGPALQAAFENTEGIYVMLPANFAPSPGFTEPRALIATLADAIKAAQPRKVVALSSIGAHRTHGLGLITQLHLLEQALAASSRPITFVRPAWFMENAAWDIRPAAETGRFPSFLQPFEKVIPMVATEDIGSVAASILQDVGPGPQVVELEGPFRVSPYDLAGALSSALGRRVVPSAIPRNEWETRFRGQGTAWPAPRIEMLDGFNSNWITFEGAPAVHLTGPTELQTVIDALVAQQQAATP
jgi:uncharacterized protein YbjT (DUF2867 family)